MYSIRHAMVRCALAVVLLSFLSIPLAAQSQNISGLVVDTTGGVIPGAAVQITDAAKGTLAREVVTDEGGRFRPST